MTPTARSLAELRRLGYVADVVERWIPRAKVRKDLFGIFDIVALGQDNWHHEKPWVIVGIQCTSATNHAARVTKLLGSDTLDLWLKAGGRAEVWSWSKRGERGARKLWALRREAL
jgi:hypothetical protein